MEKNPFFTNLSLNLLTTGMKGEKAACAATFWLPSLSNEQDSAKFESSRKSDACDSSVAWLLLSIPFLKISVSAAAEKVESDTKTGRRPWSTDAPVNMALSTRIQRWTSGSSPYPMVCKALSVHSVKKSSAGVECLLFHNGVTHASVWGELQLLLGGALTSRGWHSFWKHPTNSSEHPSKLLQFLGPQLPVQKLEMKWNHQEVFFLWEWRSKNPVIIDYGGRPPKILGT